MEPNIDIGRKVRLAGMKTEELNGAIGTITDGPNLETGRWTVQLDVPVGDWSSVIVLPSRLEFVSADNPGPAQQELASQPGAPPQCTTRCVPDSPPRMQEEECQEHYTVCAAQADYPASEISCTEPLQPQSLYMTEPQQQPQCVAEIRPQGRRPYVPQPMYPPEPTAQPQYTRPPEPQPQPQPQRLAQYAPQPPPQYAPQPQQQYAQQPQPRPQQQPQPAPMWHSNSMPAPQRPTMQPGGQYTMAQQPQPLQQPGAQYGLPQQPEEPTWQKVASFLGKLVSGGSNNNNNTPYNNYPQRPPMGQSYSYPYVARPPQPNAYMARPPQGGYMARPPQGGYMARPPQGYMARPPANYHPNNMYNQRPQHHHHSSANNTSGGAATADDVSGYAADMPFPGAPTAAGGAGAGAGAGVGTPATLMSADPAIEAAGGSDPSGAYAGGTGGAGGGYAAGPWDPSTMMSGPPATMDPNNPTNLPMDPTNPPGMGQTNPNDPTDLPMGPTNLMDPPTGYNGGAPFDPSGMSAGWGAAGTGGMPFGGGQYDPNSMTMAGGMPTDGMSMMMPMGDSGMGNGGMYMNGLSMGNGGIMPMGDAGMSFNGMSMNAGMMPMGDGGIGNVGMMDTSALFGGGSPLDLSTMSAPAGFGGMDLSGSGAMSGMFGGGGMGDFSGNSYAY